MREDDPRRTALLRRVDDAVQVSMLSTMQRMGDGKSPMDVVVCLGPGRCMIPNSERQPHVCPFCIKVNMQAGAHIDVQEAVQRVIGGN